MPVNFRRDYRLLYDLVRMGLEVEKRDEEKILSRPLLIRLIQVILS